MNTFDLMNIQLTPAPSNMSTSSTSLCIDDASMLRQI